MAKETNKKIVYFDIETSPNLGYYFQLYKEGNIVRKVQDWYILSFSYKYKDDPKVYVKCLADYPRYKEDKTDDFLIVGDLWKIFNEAEVLIAHNGDKFDIRKVNARLLYHGYTPPTPYKTIDTKKIAKMYFNFDSNKLNDIAEYFGIGEKLHTDIDLWMDCMAGKKKAWKTMCEYNKQDVLLLEKVYLQMRGWMKNHPNLNLINETRDKCPNCGGDRIKAKPRPVKNGFRQQYQCKKCHAYSTDKKTFGSVDAIN